MSAPPYEELTLDRALRRWSNGGYAAEILAGTRLDAQKPVPYLGRDDLHTYRSKETHLLVGFLQQHPGTVVFFAHRHSLKGFEQALESMSPDLHLTHITPLGESWTKGLQTEFCYMAVVERR